MERLTEIHDILNKMQFFNQRAGRELWNDKPTSVQDEDIANRDRDIEEVREFINNIVEQLKAENQGLLLKLPCKVGTTVYEVTNHGIKGHWDEHRWIVDEWSGGIVRERTFNLFMLADGVLGKTVFLTEQEAQAELEKMKGE